MTDKEEFVGLADLLAQAINAVHVSSIDDNAERDRLTSAHNLANRFFQYSLTVLHLASGKNVQELPSFGSVHVADPASVEVLTRATMEAFLVFHRVFYSAASESEKDYRYLAYKAAGLAERQKLPTDVPEHIRRIAEERRTLKNIRCKLDLNPVFQSLPPSRKRGLFEGKERDLWRWEVGTKNVLSWQRIATDTGLGKIFAVYAYGSLSGHAHSGSLSVLQTQQAIVRGETEVLVYPLLNMMKILIANMIHEYTELFPEAKQVLSKVGLNDLVDIWIQIGQRLDENQDAF